MNKKILYNFIYQSSYQLLLIILPIITIPIVSRALGPQGIGTYQYVYSISGYFVLIAGLGLQNYGVREIAIVKKEKRELSQKFWELFFLNLGVSIIVLLIYLLLIPFFEIQYRIFFIVQSVVVFSCLWDISWFFGGIEDFKTVTYRNFIIKIATFICIVSYIKDENDLIMYFIIMGLSILLGQISLWITLNKKISWVSVTLAGILGHLKPTLSFFIAKISFQFYYSVSITLLGIFGTMSDVGYFSNGYNLIAISGSIINALNTVMIPRMSNMYSHGDEINMVKLLQKTIHIQLYLSIAITFGIIAINTKMIHWFYGEGFESLKIIVPFIALGLPFQILQTAVAAQYLIPKREMKIYNVTVIIGAGINFLINILTIPYIGVFGAILGYLISYIILGILRSSPLLKMTNFRFNWKLIGGSIFSGLVMWGIISIVTRNWTASIKTTLFQILIGVVIFVLTTTLMKINPLLDGINLKKLRISEFFSKK